MLFNHLIVLGWISHLPFCFKTEETANIVERDKYKNLNLHNFPTSLLFLRQELSYNLDIITISLVVQNTFNRNQMKTTGSKKAEVTKNEDGGAVKIEIKEKLDV